MINLFSTKKSDNKISGNYYEDSTQKWLPIETVVNGIVVLKDGRYIKILEILPVNFYLKSEVEQENIIYYFASYLKIAPDNMQIRVSTERANIDDYLKRDINKPLVKSIIVPASGENFNVELLIENSKNTLMKLSLFAGGREAAISMRKHLEANSWEIYTKIAELATAYEKKEEEIWVLI